MRPSNKKQYCRNSHKLQQHWEDRGSVWARFGFALPWRPGPPAPGGRPPRLFHTPEEVNLGSTRTENSRDLKTDLNSLPPPRLPVKRDTEPSKLREQHARRKAKTPGDLGSKSQGRGYRYPTH